MKIKRAGAIFLIAAILFTTLGAGADELVAQAAQITVVTMAMMSLMPISKKYNFRKTECR